MMLSTQPPKYPDIPPSKQEADPPTSTDDDDDDDDDVVLDLSKYCNV